MLKIYICEDQEKQRLLMREITETTIAKHNLDIALGLVTDNPVHLLEAIKKDQGIGIYFLDIELSSSMNGIELAHLIREQDTEGYLIFVTSHHEMSYLTFEYKLEAMDYIIKSMHRNIKERVESCILTAYERHKQMTPIDKVFQIKVEDRQINVKYTDILFFETSDKIHRIKLHAKNRQLEFYGSLKHIEDALGGQFIRSHKSFLVNRDNISEIDKTQKIITMVNQETCYISSRYLKHF